LSTGGEVVLLRIWSDGEAMIVQQLLAQYGIRSRVVSDVPHALLPLTVDGLGEVRILIAAEALDDATALLAEHRRQGLEVAEDPGA